MVLVRSAMCRNGRKFSHGKTASADDGSGGAPDGRLADELAEAGQLAVHPAVAPGRILTG